MDSKIEPHHQSILKNRAKLTDSLNNKWNTLTSSEASYILCVLTPWVFRKVTNSLKEWRSWERWTCFLERKWTMWGSQASLGMNIFTMTITWRQLTQASAETTKENSTQNDDKLHFNNGFDNLFSTLKQNNSMFDYQRLHDWIFRLFSKLSSVFLQ